MSRPYDATTLEELLALETDNFPQDSLKWSILHNGDDVSIHAPNSAGWVSIPVDQFRAMVDWFTADQPGQERTDGR